MCVTVRLFAAYKTDLLGVSVVTSAKGAEKETRGVNKAWQTSFLFFGWGGGGEGDVYWHLPLPFHCWREKVGLNMTRGSRIPITEIHQNEHTVSLSPAEHLSSPPADIKTFSGHRAFHTLSHTHTHTKTILINTCRKFITDADAAQYARSTTTTYDQPTKRSSQRNRNP